MTTNESKWPGEPSGFPRAIVLCGGMGVRLRPLTDKCPKPLVHVRGRPIIDFVVSHLRSSGVSEVVLAGGYRCEMLFDHFRDTDIQVVDTGSCDISRRLQQLDDGLATELLVLYGDTLSNVNLTDLMISHRQSQMPATVTVWPLRSSFGVFDVDSDSRVRSYREKPTLDKWINIGYFIFSRQAIDLVVSSGTFESALHQLVDSGSLNAFCHEGLHVTVNTQSELEEAEAALATWQSVG